MSRFFQGSSSESESSEEESLYSEEEEERDAEDSEEEDSEEDEDESDDDSDESGSATGVNRFLRSDDEESDDEEEEDKGTVVKSARDKKFEELEGTVRLIENAEKIGDWPVISSGKSSNSSGKLPRLTAYRVRQAQPTAAQTHQGQRWQSAQTLCQDCRRSGGLGHGNRREAKGHTKEDERACSQRSQRRPPKDSKAEQRV